MRWSTAWTDPEECSLFDSFVQLHGKGAAVVLPKDKALLLLERLNGFIFTTIKLIC